MKKIIIALILLIVLTFSTLLGSSSAVAAPLKTDQGIAVFQANQGKTVAVGKDLFTLKKFVNKDTSTAVSLVQITHAPEYKGAFLLEKQHLLLESTELNS